jgi:hypothetical protein
MENIDAAVELTAATWNQWVGATLRQAHAEHLLATARRRRRRPRSHARRGSCANPLWMLVASAVGFWLLRL